LKPSQTATATARAIPFRDFIAQVNPTFKFYRHVDILVERLQQVADGSIDRLMVFLPPRHTKSELVSRLFSAYYLYRYPDRWVGLNSYGANLAYSLSRNARDNYRRMGGQIKGDAAAVEQWETGKGGGMWAAGVGGAITGKGFHLGIIDDPVKNAEEANSEVIRTKHSEWYSSTFYTRGEPGNAIIVIQTRWNEGDLSGWLLAQEHEEQPERWHVVNLPAVAEEQPQEFPEACTVEPDFRTPGEALCPERYPLDKLAKLAKRVGTYFWNSLYQQNPVPLEGGMFKRAWFVIANTAPKVAQRIRAWDFAATEGAGDYTAGVLMAKDNDGVFYVEDVVRGQFSDLEVERIVEQTTTADAARHGNVTTWLEQEPGSSGKAVAKITIRALAGHVVKAERSTGDKSTRAQPYAAQCEALNVKLVRGDWNTPYLNELAGFPHGSHDDQVDASSLAFTKLALTKQRREAQAHYG
jgi:predicted phage terminase large subunit-like protein